MIVLIGVGHVFKIQGKLINLIYSLQPDVICVELDTLRAESLIALAKENSKKDYRDNQTHRKKKKDTRELPFLYQILAMLQSSVADKFETQPGMEMLAAIEIAKLLGAKLEFIDIDAITIAERVWREMSFIERWKFIAGIFFGFFLPKKSVEKSMEEFVSDEARMIASFGKEFPTLKRILIDERNEYMGWRIAVCAREYENVVCVVGEGHIEGISKNLTRRGFPHRIVHLKNLLYEKNTEFSCSWVY
ncbi:MAG: TraB domain-containing protein [Thermoplasmata archaeon]